MSSPPRRRLLVDQAALAAEQAARDEDDDWHSTMPTAEDCPDHVISFEPVWDEMELDFMEKTEEDSDGQPVYRKTMPVPCRAAPRKVMPGVCHGDGSECTEAVISSATGAAEAVGECIEKSVMCRQDAASQAAPQSAQSRPSR